MRFSRAYLAPMLVLSLASGAAFAAEAPPKLSEDKPVTLQQCIEYALAQHASVLSAEQQAKSSKAEITRAQANFMPRITAESGYTGSGGQGIINKDGARENTYSTSTVSTIGITENFWDGGKTQAAVREAKASARAAIAGVDLARQNRALTVTRAYFSALLTKRLADIAAQTVTSSEEQLKLIQARVDTGDGAKVDVYPVEVQLANAKLAKLQADNDARVAATNLRNAVGLDRGPELKLVDVSAPEIKVDPLDDCIKCALQTRPEIVQSTADVDSASAGLNLAKLQALPIPTASAGFGRNLSGADYDQKWSFGIGLSLNIFDGGASQAGIQSAKARLESAKLADEQSRKDISAEVESAYLNLTSSLERLSASKPNVELAKMNLDVAREKYAQGLGIPLEIVNAQVSYADAQASNVRALYDCYVARAQLDIAMGKRGY